MRIKIPKFFSRKCPSGLPSNAFIHASYPKSGNTWLAFMILSYMHEKRMHTEIANDLIQSWHGPTTYSVNTPLTLIKTHTKNTSYFNKIPTLLLVRDPRNIVVSYYEGLRKHGHIALDLKIGRFVEEFVTGIKYDQFGTWSSCIESYLASANAKSHLHILKYEDLEKNTNEELGKVISFLDLKLNKQNLVESIKNSSRENMRHDQKKNRKSIDRKNNALPGFENQLFTNKDSRNWDKFLSPKDSEIILEEFGETMEKFNYA